MDTTKIIDELTDICARQASLIDRLYLELAKMGAAECMGEEFSKEASDLARYLQKYTR